MRTVAKLASVLVAALVSLGVGVYFENEHRPSLEYGGAPRPFDSASQPWAEHLAANVSRGFGAAEDSEEENVQPGAWSRSISLSEGECVALSLYAYGCLGVESLALQTEGVAVSGVGSPRQIQTVEHCAHTAAETLEASAALRGGRGCVGREYGLRVAVQRGSSARFAHAAGLRSQVSGRAQQRAAVLGALAQSPAEGRLLSATDSVMEQGLQLLPRNEATCQEAARQASEGGMQDRFPRTAGGLDGCRPEGVDAPVGPPSRGEGGRIVAVVDPGALEAACVSVTLARLLSDERAETPRVFSREGNTMDRVTPSGSGYRFEHHVCAQDVVTYVVSATDQEDYRIEVREASPDAGAEVTAATPRPTFPIPRALPESLVADERACQRARPDRDACLRLGTALYTAAPGGRFDPARSREAFRRGCEAGSAEACGFAAEARQVLASPTSTREPAGATFLRACEAGSARACAAEGDQLRRTAGAPQDAMDEADRFYGLACEGGVEEACVNQRLMRRFELVSVAVEEPTPAPSETPDAPTEAAPIERTVSPGE